MTKTIIILLQSLYELNREDETDFNKSLKNNFSSSFFEGRIESIIFLNSGGGLV